MAHDDAAQRRAALASLFATSLDVGAGVVVRVRLSPRAWREALARNVQERLAALGADAEQALEIAIPDATSDPKAMADGYKAAMNQFMAMQTAMTKAKSEGELAAVREMLSSVESSSQAEHVTIEDVLATPEMVEAILAALEAAAAAKDKKGEAGAVSPSAGQSSEAATPAN